MNTRFIFQDDYSKHHRKGGVCVSITHPSPLVFQSFSKVNIPFRVWLEFGLEVSEQ